VVADLRRARAARSGVEDDGVDPADAPLEQSLLAWRIEEAMRRIDEHQRQVLVDTFHRGRPCAEVAAELGVPEATVKRHVYEGLRALRGALAEVAVESWEPREHR
jgi:RNA polymerase sigma-70 factor (ECF subfamily)